MLNQCNDISFYNLQSTAGYTFQLSIHSLEIWYAFGHLNFNHNCECLKYWYIMQYLQLMFEFLSQIQSNKCVDDDSTLLNPTSRNI